MMISFLYFLALMYRINDSVAERKVRNFFHSAPHYYIVIYLVTRFYSYLKFIKNHSIACICIQGIEISDNFIHNKYRRR